VSAEGLTPELNSATPESKVRGIESAELIDDPVQLRQGVTSLYLGLFSISPLLFVFQAWAFIPSLLLCVWVLWQSRKLNRQGIKTVFLPVMAWMMVVLSIDVFFIYPDLDYQVRVEAFNGTFLYSLILAVAISGIFVLPILAISAIIYGFKAKLYITGIVAGIIHLLCWAIFGVSVLGYYLMGVLGS
jgi:hypothetical protein